ncbi:MAG TPA: preprotein translocase subunit SecE [Candidatus Limnocylindrales bacterium]|nr:preprotein translocase subunit SecE [Candidatus Limnocylindrales bacterium]
MTEAWSELKKVTWPTPEQTRNLTVLVFVVSALVGIFIFSVDAVFTSAFQFIAKGS